MKKMNTGAKPFITSDREAREFLCLRESAAKERTKAEDLEALKLLFGPEAEFDE